MLSDRPKKLQKSLIFLKAILSSKDNQIFKKIQQQKRLGQRSIQQYLQNDKQQNISCIKYIATDYRKIKR